ncbi:methyltransferase domain-containing protein [Patescibacteria group bacterium]|nr:MAG: methyltransferase domain-containing protein [Patescibacteria group bacterium]
MIKKTVKERGEIAPEGWMTNKGLAEMLKKNKWIINTKANQYRRSYPQWFKAYLIPSLKRKHEHYHPKLVEIIIKEIENEKEYTEKDKLKKEMCDFVQELINGSTDKNKDFQSIIRVCGPSRYLDILYKFHPEYKGLPVDYVKGVIADYLGDFLVAKGEFRPEDVPFTLEYLSDITFQEGLYETIKDNCLKYYFEQKRAGKKDSHEIIYGYLDHMVSELGHLNNSVLDDIIQKVIVYYDSVLRDFYKPSKFVNTLSKDREFPDLNQKINMKELTEKKRLLIADEMGLGKSASVIMAKEQLRIKCALVVAPSNVLNTWQQYLSEVDATDPKRGGYFKSGQAPRVLKVENDEDLDQVNATNYDYILISQERLSGANYVDKLLTTDYDMLIADEVHKLKRLESARAPELLRLAGKIEGKDKYLALLSGTPIPNKIEDLALLLKLLYPKKFASVDSDELIQQIICGDTMDLRALLLPRMQMKNLEEGVEMPTLTEETIKVELDKLEKDIYEVLLEENELTASEKIIMLRQFLLNPELLNSTPGIEGSKIKELSNSLDTAFRHHDKIVVFVNDYIEGIMRGEKSIIKKLQLPADVTIRAIHGETGKEERLAIQQELRPAHGKFLLFVSGQTADVGVDYSGAQHVFFYNEPWTEYQKRQELGRVYRPGLEEGLESDTLVSVGTIEEGIHEYIRRKYIAVEKLLRGIPITDLEKELLEKDEKSKEPDLSVNPELAQYYFSSWDKMMKIFGYVKEIGEEKFNKFLSKYAKDYADCYLDLGNRSYQSNANRVSGTLIHKLVKESGSSAESLKIIDIASGPEMLKQHIGDEYRDRIFSIDINKQHFATREGNKRVAGSLSAMPFADQSFDFANISLALHYTGFAPSKGKLERLKVLMETNRILKEGGKAIINLIYTLEPKDFEKFKEAAEVLGFRIVDGYTGEVSADKQYLSRVITLEKIKNLDTKLTTEDMSGQLGKEKLEGLKFKKTEAKLKDSRQILTSFKLGGAKIDVHFNEDDLMVLKEEQELLREGESLKRKYTKIVNIPPQEIIDHNFVRIKIGKKYILFKKLSKGSGVVIVK